MDSFATIHTVLDKSKKDWHILMKPYPLKSSKVLRIVMYGQKIPCTTVNQPFIQFPD
jgi:hypothetical protein